MKIPLIHKLSVVVFALTAATSAHAVTVQEFIGVNQSFLPDNFSVITEAEGRAGGAGLSGDWEFGLGNNGAFGQRQYDWADGAVGFDLSYDASETELTFDVVGLTDMSTTIDLSDANSILLRVARASGADGTSVLLSDLEFSSVGIVPSSIGSNDDFDLGNFLYFTDIDGASDWSVSGTALIVGGRQSRPAFQFKIGETATPIPLPAAAWMLLAGVGGIAAMSRRKKS